MSNRLSVSAIATLSLLLGATLADAQQFGTARRSRGRTRRCRWPGRHRSLALASLNPGAIFGSKMLAPDFAEFTFGRDPMAQSGLLPGDHAERGLMTTPSRPESQQCDVAGK
jgi:hypothetical protein